jgi:hypothetical protein
MGAPAAIAEYGVELGSAFHEEARGSQKDLRRLVPMRKIMALSLFAILTASVSFSETIEHPRNLKEEARIHSKAKRKLMWSTVALVAASFADVHSSWGKRESNPALQSANGGFGARGFGVKMGMIGGVVLGQYFLVKSKPELANAAAWTNFGIAGVTAGVAARNYTIAKPKYLMKPE